MTKYKKKYDLYNIPLPLCCSKLCNTNLDSITQRDIKETISRLNKDYNYFKVEGLELIKRLIKQRQKQKLNKILEENK